MTLVSSATRQIILDTETTGMNQGAGPVYQGHRIIEIGGVEVINRKLTGRYFHQYINPDQKIDEEAIAVHGITDEQVANCPRFHQIAQEFLEFVDGAEIVAHNASFDISFLDYELSRLTPQGPELASICGVLDTLALAKRIHPGQKNNLDALCKRYFIDNSRREYHGALLDAEILADVYLAMTGGQVKFNLSLESDDNQQNSGGIQRLTGTRNLTVIRASAEELTSHEQRLDLINKGHCLWRLE